MSSFVKFSVNAGGWGIISFLKAVPQDGDPWGVLRKYKGTFIENYINIVSDRILEDALRGIFMPLVRGLGPHPHLISKKIPNSFFCMMHTDKSCGARNKNCVPGQKTPVCYTMSFDIDDYLTSDIVPAIREGSYILVCV